MNKDINRRVHLHETPSADAISPISYSVNKVDSSVIMRCLRQGSPSSPALRYGTTSLKVVDDDVLVMDGVLVTTGSFSASYAPNATRKSELCRSWEDHGQCRYGSKCQYAHGQEEVRPASYLLKKTEILSLKCFNVEPPPLHEIKHRFPLLPTNNEMKHNPNDSSFPSSSSKTEFFKTPASTHMKQDDAQSATNNAAELWSPVDDGIEVPSLNDAGSFPSRGEVTAHVSNVLYGENRHRRLRVFADICEE